MKTLKTGIMSFFLGVALSIVPISVYAACDAKIEFEGTTCQLVGESCDQHVCVCAYICGPVT